jgi:hypothetical protein
VLGDVAEVAIRRQQRQFMAHAQLGQQRINGSCLDAALAAEIAQCCGGNVIFAIGHEERQGAEMFHDLILRPGPRKTLQQFLQYQAGRRDALAGSEYAGQFMHFRHVGGLVAPQHQRPDAGVREYGQRRDLSFL